MSTNKQEICPLCDGKRNITLKNGDYEGQYILCWRCKGTGLIPKIEILRGLLFEAMVQDSVNLRQRLLWSEVESDLKEAIEVQIQCFEENIKESKEEECVIEELKDHLKNFKEWSEYFLMDVKVIYKLRNEDGSEGTWIKR